MAAYKSEPACAGIEDPNIYYSYKREDQVKALEICSSCPIREACLQTALDNRERWGIWGGVSQHKLRVTQSIDLDGNYRNYGTGYPVQCTNCGRGSKKNVEIIDKVSGGYKVLCNQCGLEWTSKKKI